MDLFGRICEQATAKGPGIGPHGPETRSPGDPGQCPDGPRLDEALHVTQERFRAVHRPSGPDFGRTVNGKSPKSGLRPALGRPEGLFCFFPGISPAKIRPGRPIYGPEALLQNIKYILNTTMGRNAKSTYGFWTGCQTHRKQTAVCDEPSGTDSRSGPATKCGNRRILAAQAAPTLTKSSKMVADVWTQTKTRIM